MATYTLDFLPFVTDEFPEGRGSIQENYGSEAEVIARVVELARRGQIEDANLHYDDGNVAHLYRNGRPTKDFMAARRIVGRATESNTRLSKTGDWIETFYLQNPRSGYPLVMEINLVEGDTPDNVLVRDITLVPDAEYAEYHGTKAPRSEEDDAALLTRAFRKEFRRAHKPLDHLIHDIIRFSRQQGISDLD